MRDRNNNPPAEPATSPVNPGYAAFQIAKALTTSEVHEDASTRERAREKIAKWEKVLQNIFAGSVDYGSRIPVAEVPAWATLEVVTGGFATGRLLASGPLEEHEKSLLEKLPGNFSQEPRRALNAYFLTDDGLADLSRKLQTGCYDVSVPEEAALLVVAWLVENGYSEDARELLSELSPQLATLRFYPAPLEQPRRFGSRVHLQDVGSTINDLQKIRPNQQILAQKEAVEVWAPWYDRMISLFLETVSDDWPCRQYPSGWATRALGLLDEYAELRQAHTRCGKPDRAKGHFAQLRKYLDQCARDPESLSGRDVGRIRLMLARYLEKRGEPGSSTCSKVRQSQFDHVKGPTFREIAHAVLPRFENYSRTDGLDEVDHLKQPITKDEAAQSGVPVATAIPKTIQRKIERCLNDTVEVLVARHLITSGETLARVLPQMISGLQAAAISDSALGQLYGAIYRAFRRRRSLLLLNLEKQVQIEELPWIKAIEKFRTDDPSNRELSQQALEEVSVLALTSFPHVILPNKLLRELRALVKAAELEIPLVEEVAADIFMGRFSDRFLEAAKIAAGLMEGTLYANYYGIDYSVVRRIPQKKKDLDSISLWPWRRRSPDDNRDLFAGFCAARAEVSLDTWDVATRGMIIEQQQIVTTQNLAALFLGLRLTDALRDQLDEMARQCFVWICKRQQMKAEKWHARLIMLKNTAYAWRQMIFFVALVPNEKLSDFIGWAVDHLEQQPEAFRNRFRPALQGLESVAEGRKIGPVDELYPNGRQFLGWCKGKHWLLEGE